MVASVILHVYLVLGTYFAYVTAAATTINAAVAYKITGL
jgi:hypothetical protein